MYVILQLGDLSHLGKKIKDYVVGDSMIELRNVVKRYKKDKNKTEALKGINLKFANKGLVFIVGKSGSGKSTLLNLIGGLDYPTSGKIICNGIEIHNNKKDFELYRSNCIGFVFQDYCLIESMSVYDNIDLAMSLNKKKDELQILTAIANVGLRGKEHTPVNLLSGGQKQRVAIARALVKNPSVLLADEPTGNLDTKTSTQIFKILKNLSKDQLIIVISHNLNEAYKYADRIIELSDGKVISDLDRVDDKKIKKEIAMLPMESKLSKKEITSINKKIKDDNVMIRKNDMLFDKHKDIDEENNHIEYSYELKRFKDKWKLFKFFIKKKIWGMIVTSLMISVLVVLMGLCQSYYIINEKELLQDAVNKDDKPMVFRKGYYNEITEALDTRYLGAVSDEDIEGFINAGYDGDIYKLYRYPIPLTSSYDNISRGLRDSGLSFSNSIYPSTNGLGVLITNEEYLTNLYGVNGELVVLSGDLDLNPYGIVITDYFADSILSKNTKYISTGMDKYEKLINTDTPIMSRYSINAVIDTGYEEKYKSIIEEVAKMKLFPSEATKIKAKLLKSELVKELISESNSYLNIGYSFNPNFIEDTVNNPLKANTVHFFENPVISDENHKEIIYSKQEQIVIDGTSISYIGVNDGEVYVTPSLYNSMYGTTLTYKDQTGFVEKDIYIDLYTSSRGFEEEAKFSKKLRIKGLVNSSSNNTFVVSENDFKEFRKKDMSAYALYFDGGNNEDVVYQVAEDYLYKGSSTYIAAIQEICDVTGIFKSIFEILIIGLISATVILLSSYSVRMVHSFKRELGIIRAMGGKSKDFAIPFSVIVILIGAIAALVSSIGIHYVCDFVNELIVSNFVARGGLDQIADLVLFKVSSGILISNLIILFAIIFISSYIPILIMKKIKLVNILRRE